MRKTRTQRGVVIGLIACLTAAQAGDRPALVNQLIRKIVANEQAWIEQMKNYHPIAETYIQETLVTQGAEGPLTTDHYLVGKLDLSSKVQVQQYAASDGFRSIPGKNFSLLTQQRSIIPFRKKRAKVFLPDGFAQMVLLDAYEFHENVYGFEYVRREFLGDVRCLVFDVSPKDDQVGGKFIGRIWVEDKDYRIVRFNGTYTRSKVNFLFFHFDSWRVNVEPGLWIPAVIYVQDANPLNKKGDVKESFKGQTRIWGYHTAGGSKLDELTEILVEAENPVQDHSGSKDISPMESQRSWRKQAEQNVIQRLERAGLLAVKGEVDGVLDTVLNNLLVTNNIPRKVHGRVLLTTPLETFSIGESVVISRGLMDVLPDEASLAMVLAGELAHIVLGHGAETMYAFGDKTMLGDEELLTRLRLNRTAEEMKAANRKAVEILSRSPYQENLGQAGLFLRALGQSAAALPNLIAANLGNQLANGDNLLRMGELVEKAPPLEEGKIEQIAALPLGSRIKLDPWTNRVSLIEAKPLALLSAKDKMPFEVTPFFLHLTRVAGAPAASEADTATAGR